MANRKYSEKTIQNYLREYVISRGHYVFAPNIYMFGGWEMDYVSLNTFDYVYEFEIKTTEPDFKADFSKVKHQFFRSFLDLSPKLGILKDRKYKQVVTQKKSPNYFYFVVPNGLIPKTKIPSYAGLIYVYSNGKCKVIKRAKLLHKKKNTAFALKKIAISLSHRFRN